jgi:cyclopropane fatty-acyl-phospholipid synthase-like methyltransferase
MEPHEDMPGLARLLKERQGQTILDLGCGTGRHTVYLAQQGFSVHGLDNSPHGLEMTRRWLADEGLQADLRLQNMTEGLPYGEKYFDAVVSVQVIHHANLATIRGIVREIFRVLNKGGYAYVTVAMMMHYDKKLEQVEPGTFVPLNGPEKGLLHHFFTPAELRELFKDFEVRGVYIDSTKHVCILAFKP